MFMSRASTSRSRMVRTLMLRTTNFSSAIVAVIPAGRLRQKRRLIDTVSVWVFSPPP